jgi:hypothetical protein
VWNGPFEQLTGAGYSLLAAEAHGIGKRSRRDYHNQVRRPLVARLIHHLDSGTADATVENWLAGFYFNAAKQRLVWSGERLLRALASVPCPHADLPRQYARDKAVRREILAAAKTCVAHAEATHGPGLPRTSALVKAHEAGGSLAALNDDVNARKHSLYPDAVITAGAQKPEHEQVKLSCDAFAMLVDSYLELVAWAPRAKRP